MTSINAKPQNDKHNPELVVFVIYSNFVLLDLSGPLQVFTHAQSQENHQAAYETIIVSAEGGTVKSNTIVSIESTPISEVLGQSIHTLTRHHGRCVAVGRPGVRAPAADRPSDRDRQWVHSRNGYPSPRRARVLRSGPPNRHPGGARE